MNRKVVYHKWQKKQYPRLFIGHQTQQKANEYKLIRQMLQEIKEIE